MASSHAALETDVGRVGELTTELAKLLPRVQTALASRMQETEKAEAALSAREAALAKREAVLVEREEQCKVAAQQNAKALEALKQREQEVASAKGKSGKPPMDSLSMQVLARATATALLKTQLAAGTAE